MSYQRVADDPTFAPAVRAIVREETADMRADITVLKTDVAVLKTDVEILKADVAILKTDVQEIKITIGLTRSEISGFLDHFSDTIAENRMWRENHYRLDVLEATQKDVVTIVAEHSRQLRAL